MPDKPISLSPEDCDKYARLIDDWITQAELDRGEYMEQLEENRALLKPHQELEGGAEWESDLHVPFLRQARNALSARIRRAILGNTPIFYVEGTGQASLFAGAVEHFLQRQMTKQVKLPSTTCGRALITSALDDGIGPAYVTWETRKRPKMRYVRAEQTILHPDTQEVLAQQGQTYKFKDWVTVYDGPKVALVPIENVGVFPASANSIEDASGVYLMTPMTGDDLAQFVMDEAYDADKVAELDKWTGDKPQQTSDQDNRDVNTTESSIPTGSGKVAKPYDITECYLLLPSEKEDEPGEDWLITLHRPTKTVLRAKPVVEVWAHGERPLSRITVYPDKFGILADSEADLGGEQQQYLTEITRMIVDSGRKRNKPELFISATAMSPDEKDEFDDPANRYPGASHPIRSLNDVKNAIMPFGTDGNPAELQQIALQIKEDLRTATNVSQLTMGQNAPHQITARETERMLEEGQEGIADMIETAAEGFRRIGELVLKLDYEHVSSPSLIALWEEANPEPISDPDSGQALFVTQDPQTGQPMRDTQQEMLAALSQEYDVQPAGTTATANKAIQKANAQEWFVMLKDDPFVMSDPKRSHYLRHEFLSKAGMRNPEALIGPESQAAQSVQIVQDAQNWQQLQAEMQKALQIQTTRAGEAAQDPQATAQVAALMGPGQGQPPMAPQGGM